MQEKIKVTDAICGVRIYDTKLRKYVLRAEVSVSELPTDPAILEKYRSDKRYVEESATGYEYQDGEQIYEGDVLMAEDGNQYEVVWDDYECRYIARNGSYEDEDVLYTGCTKIGTVHDTVITEEVR